MGLDKKLAAGSLRVSLSRFTTEDEVELAIDAIVRAHQAVTAAV